MFLQVLSQDVELNGETIFQEFQQEFSDLHNMFQDHCNSLRDGIIGSISGGKCVQQAAMHTYYLSISPHLYMSF